MFFFHTALLLRLYRFKVKLGCEDEFEKVWRCVQAIVIGWTILTTLCCSGNYRKILQSTHVAAKPSWRNMTPLSPFVSRVCDRLGKLRSRLVAL